jgi:predicted PurR-regulated permease PerM
MRSGVPTVPPEWTARRVALATLVVLAVLLAFYLLLRFYSVIFIFFVAVVVAVAIRPLVDWLHRRGVPRAVGVILVYLALLGLAIGFFYLLTPLLVEQVTTIAGRFPTYYQRLITLMFTSDSAVIQRIAMQLPGSLAFSIGTTAPAGQAAQGAGSLATVGSALQYLQTGVRVIFVATAILVLALYWILDGERTLRSLLLRAPADRREVAWQLIESIEDKVGAYVRGVVILSATMAVLASGAYLIIGLPYALVLGLIAGVLEALPVIGPVLGAIPAVLLALSLEPAKALWVVVAVIVMQQIEGNLLVPRVMDRAVGVNAIVTILSIIAFGSLFGLGGAIMAIPLAAVIQVLLNRFVFETTALPVEAPSGRDHYSILRYQAQELVQDVRKQLRSKDDAADGETDQLEDMIEAIATDIDSALAQLDLPAEAA